MNGEVDLEDLSDDELFALAAAAAGGRDVLHGVTVALNGRGVTFVQIGERLGVVESTASRWAKPPSPPGRRSQVRESDAGEAKIDHEVARRPGRQSCELRHMVKLSK